MENQVVLLDTSVLIDFFRKQNKRNSFFYSLSAKKIKFTVSTITRFEVFAGQSNSQNSFWLNFYKNVKILDFDDNCAFHAGKIVKQLKQENKMIEIADIFIAATALANNLPMATLNIKHFNRIDKLEVISS